MSFSCFFERLLLVGIETIGLFLKRLLFYSNVRTPKTNFLGAVFSLFIIDFSLPANSAARRSLSDIGQCKFFSYSLTIFLLTMTLFLSNKWRK